MNLLIDQLDTSGRCGQTSSVVSHALLARACCGSVEKMWHATDAGAYGPGSSLPGDGVLFTSATAFNNCFRLFVIFCQEDSYV